MGSSSSDAASTKKLAALSIIILLLLLPFASALQITDISETPNTNSAVLSYNTDAKATTDVVVSGVGTFPTVSEGVESPRLNHSISITGLAPNTAYSYYIEAAGSSSSATAKSSTRSFTTTAGNGDIFFTSNIPAVVGTDQLTIVGKTIPDAFITVLVNGQLAGGTTSGATGDVTIPNVKLDTTQSQNTIEVDVKTADPANPQTKSYTFPVQIDTIYPQLNITIPEVSTQSTVQINGTANKAMTIKTEVTYPNGQTKTFDSATLAAAGPFSFSVDLDDGANTVHVIGTDQTGSTADQTQQVTVDSQDLELDVDFSRYDPTASDIIYVTGTVNKPGIPVRIYVDPSDMRSKIGSCNYSQSKTITTSGNILDNTKCYGFGQFNEVTINGTYFEGKSDAIADNKTGSYPFSVRVELDPRLTIWVKDTTGLDLQQTSSNQFSGGLEAGIASQYSLFAVAVDNVGRVQSTSNYHIHKQDCGNTQDFVVHIGEFYPALIEPDYVFQGIAQLSFKADLQYTGAFDPNSVVITGTDLSPRQLSDADLAKLAADPQQILDTSRCTPYPSSNVNDFVYMVCNLNKYPSSAIRTNITKAYDNLSAIGQLTIPVKFNVHYSVRDNNNISKALTASQCVDLKVAFDKRLSPDKYPKGLLKSTVNVLNETVTSIDQVLKPLNTVKLVTLGACVGTKVYSVFSFATEDYYCAQDGYLAQKGMIEQVLRGCPGLTDSECVAKLQSLQLKSANTDGSQASIETSDCVSKIWDRLKTESKTNYVCDRIFCPAVPSASEYIRQVNARPNMQLTSACSTAGPYASDANGPVSSLDAQKGCGKEYEDTWSSACPTLDPLKESKNQAQAEQYLKGSNTFQTVLNNLNFCSAAQQDNQNTQTWFNQNGVVYYNDNPNNNDCFKLGTPMQAGNIGSNLVVDKSTIVNKVNSATYDWKTVGATSAPKYIATTDQNNNAACVVTANNGNVIYQFRDNTGAPLQYTTQNAAIVNVKSSPSSSNLVPTSVVKFDGKDAAGSQRMAIDQQGNYYHLDDAGNWNPVTPADPNANNYFDIVCTEAVVPGQSSSTFGVYQGNKNGKCQPIQNGPNALKQDKGKPYLINPTDGFINSVRCACLPAIEGYLIVMRNVFNAVKNCFQATLVNNEFRPGACRSLLTTYLCDWIYRAINCVTNFAAGLQKLGGASSQDRPEAIGAIASLQRGAADMSRSMQDRYGSTSTYSSLIGTHKLINAVCLAAFGYDWLPELDQAVSIKGNGFAINSTAFIVTANRRWISSNPTTGDASFTYESGYFISAGSPLRYDVYLVCSNDNSCKQEDGYGASGACDCAQGGGGKEVVHRIDGGLVQGGDTVGDADGKGQRFVTIDGATSDNPSRPLRFDKLRIVMTNTAAVAGTEQQQPQVIEAPIHRIGGQEPPTCTFSMITFSFKCDYVSTNNYGDVFFYGDKLRFEKNPYNMNDLLNLAVFAKADYTKLVGVDRQPIQPSLQLPKYVTLEIWNADHTQLLYGPAISQKGDINDRSDNIYIAGANYHVGEGVIPAGVKGTYAVKNANLGANAYDYITSAPVSNVQKLAIDANSLSASRAVTNTRYYVLLAKNLPAIPITVSNDNTRAAINRINNLCTGNLYCQITIVQSLTGVNPSKLQDLQTILNSLNVQSVQVTSTFSIVVAKNIQKPQDLSNQNIVTDLNSANLLLDIDPSNGVQVKLPSALPSDNSPVIASAIIDYDTSSTAGLLCQPNQQSVQLLAVVSLHDSMAKDKRSDASIGNSQYSPAVFVYQGQQQLINQTFTVMCPGYQTTANGEPSSTRVACDVNSIITSAKYPAVLQPTKIDGGCYCSDIDKTNIFDQITAGISQTAICLQSGLGSKSPTPICAPGIKGSTICACVSPLYNGAFKFSLSPVAPMTLTLQDGTNVPLCSVGSVCDISAGNIVGSCK